ncbi:MAG: hypothetical protein Kow0098_14970 [Ignavibacteriaceae bacterium]
MKTHFIFNLLLILFFYSKISYSQWNTQYSGPPVRMFCIQFVNENIGWAGGDVNTLMKTTDGGGEWFFQPIPVFNYLDFIHSLSFVDTLEGWLAVSGYVTPGTTGIRHFRILHTTDGGFSWEVQLTVYEVLAHNIKFSNSQEGILVGSSGIVYRTSNGGDSWISEYTSFRDYGEWLFALYYKGGIGFIGGQTSGKIARTTDGGDTWYIHYLPVLDWILSIHFVNETTGWAVGENGTILKTTDSGLTWDIQISGTSELLRDVRFTDANNGWVVGLGGTVLHTTDSGMNWNKVNGVSNKDLYAVHFQNKNLGWIAGYYTNVINYNSNPSNVTSDPDIINYEYKLDQNFPNPFNPSTQIKFTLKERNFVNLTVYDMLGRQVAVLINNTLDSGEHTINFEAANLASGVYTYRLQAGEFVESRKMILQR